MYILDFVKDVNKFIKPFRNWVLSNTNNPLFWIGVVAIVVLIVTVAYNLLHGKD